jgi:hypothetical protein
VVGVELDGARVAVAPVGEAVVSPPMAVGENGAGVAEARGVADDTDVFDGVGVAAEVVDVTRPANSALASSTEVQPAARRAVCFIVARL